MNDGPEIHRRRSRFARDGRGSLCLTPDDLAIIGYVGRHRFLRSAQLLRLFPHRSPQNFLWCLASLYHAGYLDRPKAQINYFASSGSSPIVYALGNKGAALHARMRNAAPALTDWTDKNRSLTRPYIEHALLVADIMIGLEPQVHSRADLQLVRDGELRAALPPVWWQASMPWTLDARIAQDGKHQTLSVAPDAVFALHFPASDRRSNFFLEADRATMPIERRSLSQTSFKNKLSVYLAAHRADQHLQRFGFRNFRVLTVTTSPERLRSILAVVTAITNGQGSGMFLFTDLATLKLHADLLSLPWHSTKGHIRIDLPPRS